MRNESTILMSIAYQWFQRILQGNKKWEYRKRLPKNMINLKRIIFRIAYPYPDDLFYVDIGNILKMKPCELWEKTGHESGMTEEEFYGYFIDDKKEAYAIPLVGQLTQIDSIKISNPPQSWRYLKDDELELLKEVVI